MIPHLSKLCHKRIHLLIVLLAFLHKNKVNHVEATPILQELRKESSNEYHRQPLKLQEKSQFKDAAPIRSHIHNAGGKLRKHGEPQLKFEARYRGRPLPLVKQSAGYANNGILKLKAKSPFLAAYPKKSPKKLNTDKSLQEFSKTSGLTEPVKSKYLAGRKSKSPLEQIPNDLSPAQAPNKKLASKKSSGGTPMKLISNEDSSRVRRSAKSSRKNGSKVSLAPKPGGSYRKKAKMLLRPVKNQPKTPKSHKPTAKHLKTVHSTVNKAPPKTLHHHHFSIESSTECPYYWLRFLEMKYPIKGAKIESHDSWIKESTGKPPWYDITHELSTFRLPWYDVIKELSTFQPPWYNESSETPEPTEDSSPYWPTKYETSTYNPWYQETSTYNRRNHYETSTYPYWYSTTYNPYWYNRWKSSPRYPWGDGQTTTDWNYHPEWSTPNPTWSPYGSVTSHKNSRSSKVTYNDTGVILDGPSDYGLDFDPSASEWPWSFPVIFPTYW